MMLFPSRVIILSSLNWEQYTSESTYEILDVDKFLPLFGKLCYMIEVPVICEKKNIFYELAQVIAVIF